MMTIDSNIKKLTKDLKRTQKVKVPSAIRNGLNTLAKETSKRLKIETKLQVDRPTPFTLKGIRYQETDKVKLSSKVGFLSQEWNGFKGGKMANNGVLPGDYMHTIWKGGLRRPKKRFIPVPTKKSNLNKYGNLRRNVISKYLSNNKRYFQGIPKGIQSKEANGIWRRVGNRYIEMIIAYEPITRYGSSYDFDGIVRYFVNAKWKRIFENDLNNVLKKSGLLYG